MAAPHTTTKSDGFSHPALAAASPALDAPAGLSGQHDEFDYLNDESDLRTLLESVELTRALVNARAFDEWRGVPIDEWPKARSELEIQAQIRNTATTMYHPAGTCKMGTDALAVVNSQLRVYGVEGLRVADASVMPTVVNGNTNAPCSMIGEKAADMIRRSRV